MKLGPDSTPAKSEGQRESWWTFPGIATADKRLTEITKGDAMRIEPERKTVKSLLHRMAAADKMTGPGEGCSSARPLTTTQT
jgi:hypothetical protein